MFKPTNSVFWPRWVRFKWSTLILANYNINTALIVKGFSMSTIMLLLFETGR